jgi:Spy/CpxP family protein refolding chaperone
MSKKLAAILITVLMGFSAGNAAAMMGGDKGMMDCKCMDGGGKGMMMQGGGMGGGMGGHFAMMIEMLGLNAEQQKAVEAIHFAHRKELIKKTADLDIADIELQEIMGKEPVNTAEAEQQIRAIAALQADLDVMHLKAKAAVKAQMTPEQLAKMKKHMPADMKAKMEGMGGMSMPCDKMDCGKMPCGKMPCDMMDCGKMPCGKMPCDMMKDASSGMKAPAGSKDAKADEKKADHSRHH